MKPFEQAKAGRLEEYFRKHVTEVPFKVGHLGEEAAILIDREDYDRYINEDSASFEGHAEKCFYCGENTDEIIYRVEYKERGMQQVAGMHLTCVNKRRIEMPADMQAQRFGDHIYSVIEQQQRNAVIDERRAELEIQNRTNPFRIYRNLLR